MSGSEESLFTVIFFSEFNCTDFLKSNSQFMNVTNINNHNTVNTALKSHFLDKAIVKDNTNI